MYEAIFSKRHIIAPNTKYYLNITPKTYLDMFFDPAPEAYAHQMYKILRNRFFFRVVCTLDGLKWKI